MVSPVLSRKAVSASLICLFFIASDAHLCTPHGTNSTGDCVPARSCRHLHQEFQPVRVPDFVTKHSCGVTPDTKNVLVCCPRVLPDVKNKTFDELSSTAMNVGFSGNNHSGFPNNFPHCGYRRVNEGAPWPFVVGLGRVEGADDRITIYCMGVLIRPQWVLAHPLCFQLQLITMAFFGLGHANRSRITMMEVDLLQQPSDFDPNTELNSVGLARLQHPVTLTDDIQMVCLPSATAAHRKRFLFVIYIKQFDDGTKEGGYEVQSLSTERVPIDICRGSRIGQTIDRNNHICTNSIKVCDIHNVPIVRPILLGQDTSADGLSIIGLGGSSFDYCLADIMSFYKFRISKNNYIFHIMSPTTTVDFASSLFLDLMGYFARREDITVCGRRAVGKGQQVPFIVSLGNRFFDDVEGNWTYSSHCTGVIVSPSWVLTDAHCLHRNVINYVKGGQKGKSSWDAKVASFKTPPDYKPGQEYNSVALVKLETPLNFTVNIQPVCLPQEDAGQTFPFVMSISIGYYFVDEVKANYQLAAAIWHVKIEPHEKCLTSRFILSKLRPGLDACTTSHYECNDYLSPPIFLELGFDRSTYSVGGVGGTNANFCHGYFMNFVRVKPYLSWIHSVIDPKEFADIYDLTEITISFNRDKLPRKYVRGTVTFDQLLEASSIHNLDLFEVFVKNRTEAGRRTDGTVKPPDVEAGRNYDGSPNTDITQSAGNITHARRDFSLASALSLYSSRRNVPSSTVKPPDVDTTPLPVTPEYREIVFPEHYSDDAH